MKKTVILSILLVILFISNFLFGEAKTIAILDFSNNSLVDKDKYASLSKGLAEIMITELSKLSSLRLVERQKLNSLIEEMKLSQSGIISEDTGIQVGKILGAQYLVFGSYMISFNNQIRIDVRIVNVETGATPSAEQITDKVDNLFKIINKLNEKITANLNIKLSKQEKKLLNSDDFDLDIIAQFSNGLDFEENNNVEDARKIYSKILKKEPDFEPAKKRLNAITDLD